MNKRQRKKRQNKFIKAVTRELLNSDFAKSFKASLQKEDCLFYSAVKEAQKK